MGLFLPTLFQSLRKWKFFVSSILMVLIGIESMQYFTRSGVGDIDDVFLYILGSSSGFYGYHMISRFVRKARNASGSLSKR
ncbi:VanZ family protein [Paenibacillus oleatilyticus]|uniref:VanZ family protein n=1 Tax=Paenibacillus oleatilyticus TaxID=2594886 RepID=UPI001C201407